MKSMVPPCIWICFFAFFPSITLVAQLEFSSSLILLESALIFDESTVNIRIKNTSGTRPIEIVSIKPSCGCTVIPNFDRTIQPKKEIDIPAKVKARRSEGRQKVTLVATWKYHDEDIEYNNYTIFERDIIDPVKLSQSKFDFGKLDPDSLSAQVSQQLIAEIDSSLVKLISINPSEALKDVFELEVRRQPEERAVLNLSLRKQDRLLGVFNGAITIRGRLLKSGAEVVWSIPVFATLESAVELKPSFVVMPKLDEGETFSEDFLVRGPPGLKVEKVVISDPKLTVLANTKVISSDSSMVSIRIGGANVSLSSSGHIDFHIVLESPGRNLIYRIQYVLIGSSEPPVSASTNE